MRYLAIDIGASSGRHIAGEIEGGKIKLKEVYRFSNGACESGGSLVWGAERLFKEVLNGLKAAGQAGLAPDFVGIDTWAVDYALLNGGEIVGDIFSYRSPRTAVVTDKVHALFPFEKLYGRTGIQFQPFNTIYQLMCDKISGKLAKADAFLMLPDYLNFRLTGVKKQEYTNATSTGMVNARTHDWDEEIISALGYDRRLFKPLSQPGESVGRFTEQVKKFVGYDAQVVLPATHDTASAVLAAPIKFGSAYISSGTWSLLGAEQEFAHTDKGSMNANYSNEGSVNFTFRYQKNITGLWMLQSVRKEAGEPTFAQMEKLARGASGVIIDVNDKRFLSPENMCREICAAAGKVMHMPELLRTVYDSLAACYAAAVKELEEGTGQTFESIHIIGGGSRDRLLNELTARATGKKVTAGPVEATAAGNIIMQMIASGEIKDVQAAREMIKKSFDIKEIEV